MATVGIFGGSGLYQLLTGAVEERWIETPYGPPSDKVVLGELGGKPVAFLPRHGRGHTIPPHKINYRANLWVMKSLGVDAVIGPCAVGSLQKHIEPGHVVLCDQFVDRTSGRVDTFYEGPIVTHVSAAEPYCPILRAHALAVCRRRGVTVHGTGTMVVVNGPRFSTKAESRWYTQMGWDIIGMTQYPEAYLARELELPYVNLSLVTDYDAGLVSEDAEAVTHETVLKVFAANIENLRGLLAELVETLPDTSASPAKTALMEARLA
ncbi:S-methyl-5'-thioadenosine phosphorylase [Armatimonas sp.]|uniref:S-methyl-5'-thioadenosine phosphorylase n=1 Tax=Armatimonas sp. TaxID=1872638 RepID=UPI00286D41C2|nr:S-methyl-5'-thioadenosine phosphorylase [Armatimonas sp.]